MDRRKFTALIGAGLLFPRTSESSPSGGLSHDQMAQLILACPENVCLNGTSYYLGRTRHYHYADEDDPFDLIDKKEDRIDEWRGAGNTIGSHCTWGEPVWSERSRSVVGSRVVVQIFDCHRRMKNEEWYEISNPLLKVIHFVGDPDWEKDRVLPRYFARFGEQWFEIT